MYNLIFVWRTQLLFCAIASFSCAEQFDPKEKGKEPAHVVDTILPNVELKTFNTEAGWGYDIYLNGKQYIHQPHQPAVSGNKGFPTELQARQVGNVVIFKLKHGMMPPTVTRNEIDSILNSMQ